MLVGTFNLFVIESMGEQCGITEMEAKFLIPSVQRTLERMPAAAATRAAIVLDPLIIVGVMVMWFKRITDVKRAETVQKYVTTPQEQARANGVSGSEYRVENDAAYTPDMFNNGHVAGGYIADNPPTTVEIPMPERPDMTANGVPAGVRETFSTDEFNSTL